MLTTPSGRCSVGVHELGPPSKHKRNLGDLRTQDSREQGFFDYNKTQSAVSTEYASTWAVKLTEGEQQMRLWDRSEAAKCCCSSKAQDLRCVAGTRGDRGKKLKTNGG